MKMSSIQMVGSGQMKVSVTDQRTKISGDNAARLRQEAAANLAREDFQQHIMALKLYMGSR
jgi:hypothetical protein